MKALIFDKAKTDWETSRGFELVDIPEPVLGEGDEDKIILKVAYAGVCGTDRGIWNRQAFKEQILSSIDAESKNAVIASPNASEGVAIPSVNEIASDALAMTKPKTYRQLGHEFFGEVKQVGSNVKDVAIGDFVACESHVVCNECFQCKNGQKNVCTNEKILGISVDGGFAEFAKVPAQVAWKVDMSKLRPEVAVLHEPFGNAVHAASKVDLKGKTVAIFGLGPIAQFLVLIVRGLGAKTIIGVELHDKAIEMGKKLGVDHIIKIEPATDYHRNHEVVEKIKGLTNGLGADVTFEMAGFNDSVNNAIASVRRGGEVILFGLKNDDFLFEDYNRLVMKGITMYCVAGRQLWGTWEITRKLLDNPENGIAEKLWAVLLNSGEGTILPISEYSKEKFQVMMKNNPKILIKF